MLEYRHFPFGKSLTYLLFSPVYAYFIYVIQNLLQMESFSEFNLGLSYLLGIGLLGGVLFLLIGGYTLDRTKRTYALIFLGALVPLLLELIGLFLTPNGVSHFHFGVFSVLSYFCGLSIVTIAWAITVNRTVVLRYRGRLSGIMIGSSLIIFSIYNIMQSGFSITLPFGLNFPFILALSTVFLSLGTKPWRWQSYPLAVSGNPRKYFIPMFLLLMAHFLWYNGTMMSIQNIFLTVGGASFTSLGEYVGWELYEPIILGAGAIISGLIADLRGRKTAFNMAVLLIGLLAIFSSTMYRIESTGPGETARVVLEALPLLLMERMIEGFLLGLCIFLIWTELGSPKTKGIRLASVLIVFVGYMSLFWVFQLDTFDIQLPGVVALVGPQFAVLLSLVALYATADTPQLRGREVEMEELSLDFSDKLVRETVDAFVEEEDIDSIRSQVDIIDVGQEISDQDFEQIMGDDFSEIIAFRDIKGIGPAMERKLKDAGYTSAAQLAGETPSRLSRRVEGIGEDRAKRILEAARKVVKAALEKNDNP